MQYAKIDQDKLIFPQLSEFAGVPNPYTNEPCMRRHGYLPLVGEAEPREGYTATPSRWHVVQQSETRIEPRQTIVEDYEENPETHEREKTGEHTEMVDTEITVDTSYIQIDEWQYTENPPEPEPEQPEDISAQLQQVIELIMHYCDKYGATEELLSLEEINIPALEGLIQKYNVTTEDQSIIMTKVQLIVLDIMARLKATWYDIWNDTVKPALNGILQQRRAASAASE